MQNKEMKIILKILGLVGAIFCLIALFVPWGGNFAFGLWTFGASSITGQWDIFYTQTMTSGVAQAILLGVVMILTFIFTLIITILAFLGIRDINTKGTKKYFISAILATVEFILFIVAIAVAGATLTGGGFGLGVGFGFVMILIAMIMFYLIFALNKILGISSPSAMYQQQTYQQPSYQQPAQPMQAYVHQQPPVQPQQPQPTQPAPAPQAEPEKTTKGTKTTKAALQFCPQCGAKLTAGVKFCPGCGNQIK